MVIGAGVAIVTIDGRVEAGSVVALVQCAGVMVITILLHVRAGAKLA